MAQMVNPAMESRKMRMELIKKLMEELMPIPYHKALAVIMVNTGASEKTAREYLKAVMLFNGYKLDINNVVTKQPIGIEKAVI